MNHLQYHEIKKRAVSFQYVEYLPHEYNEQSTEKWPLVVFLHGAGERGDDLNSVLRHGLMKRIAQGEEFPFVVIAPQCTMDNYWGCYIESLNDFLEDMLATHHVDPSRVYLTGLSMGGTGTWLWSMANPEKFAAIAPICGTGVYWYGGKLVDVPVWAFHGDRDSIVPLSESQNMVDSVNRWGGNAKLTIYEGVDHDSWEQAYNDPELYRWLLSHKKG